MALTWAHPLHCCPFFISEVRTGHFSTSQKNSDSPETTRASTFILVLGAYYPNRGATHWNACFVSYSCSACSSAALHLAFGNVCFFRTKTHCMTWMRNASFFSRPAPIFYCCCHFSDPAGAVLLRLLLPLCVEKYENGSRRWGFREIWTRKKRYWTSCVSHFGSIALSNQQSVKEWWRWFEIITKYRDKGIFKSRVNKKIYYKVCAWQIWKIGVQEMLRFRGSMNMFCPPVRPRALLISLV